VTLPGGIEIGEYIKSLPWRDRLRIWFARFRVRRMLRQGWRPTVMDWDPGQKFPFTCTTCGVSSRVFSAPCGQPFYDSMHYDRWPTGMCWNELSDGEFCGHGPECHTFTPRESES
jgi:hypothetical protein